MDYFADSMFRSRKRACDNRRRHLHAGAVRQALPRRSSQQWYGCGRHAADGRARAACRHAGADGDQPHPEHAADRTGAQICGDPLGLASALRKIDAAAHQIENAPAEQNPATAHLFIVNPLSGARMDNLFSTHPATKNRIAALEAIAAGRPSARKS